MADVRERMHVSRNRLEGSLGDTSIERLLEACHRHLVTGTVRVKTFAGEGAIELRAGAVEESRVGDLEGKDALERMKRLSDGEYEIVQQLPDLGGDLADAAQLEGAVKGLSLIALMRHCEDNALTCTITLVDEFDRGDIVYRAGDIVEVTFNDRRDDDCIDELLRLTEARFRVAAQPLDLDIDGWPSVRREPTAPFRLDRDDDDVAESTEAKAAAKTEAKAAADGAAPTAAKSAREDEAADEAGPPRVDVEADTVDDTAPRASSSSDAIARPAATAERPLLWFGIGAVTGLAALGLMYVVALLLM